MWHRRRLLHEIRRLALSPLASLCQFAMKLAGTIVAERGHKVLSHNEPLSIDACFASGNIISSNH